MRAWPVLAEVKALLKWCWLLAWPKPLLIMFQWSADDVSVVRDADVCVGAAVELGDVVDEMDGVEVGAVGTDAGGAMGLK